MNEKVKQALKDISYVSGISVKSLCKESFDIIETALNDYEEHEKELIAEQHRLFDLAKEQEIELKELKEFTRIVATKVQAKGFKNDYWIDVEEHNSLSKNEFDLVKKVVENYETK